LRISKRESEGADLVAGECSLRGIFGDVGCGYGDSPSWGVRWQ
jgi:hypothetical protein